MWMEFCVLLFSILEIYIYVCKCVYINLRLIVSDTIILMPPKINIPSLKNNTLPVPSMPKHFQQFQQTSSIELSPQQLQQKPNNKISSIINQSQEPLTPTISITINTKKQQKQQKQTKEKQQKLKLENKQLRHTIHTSLQQIQKLKQANQQYQNQIETLLKFNQRLLIIIETQLNQYSGKKSDRSVSLQPISQITERDSQCVDGVNSIKASLLSMKFSDLNFQRENNQERQNRQNRQNDNSNNYNRYKLSPQTQRMILGHGRQSLRSYQGSHAPSSYYQQVQSQIMNSQQLNNNNNNNNNNNKNNTATLDTYLQKPKKTNKSTREKSHHYHQQQLKKQLKNYSEYQKQYSQYTPSQKIKQVLGLINVYKQQYGQSAHQYEIMKKKIKEELKNGNQEIQKIENQGRNYYKEKIEYLEGMREKLVTQGIDNQMERIIGGKYSVNVLNKIKSIIKDRQ